MAVEHAVPLITDVKCAKLFIKVREREREGGGKREGEGGGGGRVVMIFMEYSYNGIHCANKNN